MAAGIDPIYCKAPDFAFAKLTSGSNVVLQASNSSLVLASATLGTDCFSVFTAGANGGFIQKIRCKSAVSATAQNVATVLRVFIYNGVTSPATAGSSVFYDDLTLPVTTPAANAQSPAFEIQMNLALPASYQVIVALGTTVTGGGWQITGIGGQY